MPQSLASQQIQVAKTQKVKRLVLGSCGLTELPDELFTLIDLEELILSSGWEEYSFKNNKWEQFNTENEGNPNSIKAIHPNIKHLINLKSLIFKDQHELHDLTPLENLVNLERLNIAHTNVRCLKPLKKLKKLKELAVYATQVHDLNGLEVLDNLQILTAHHTFIESLIPLENLDKLRLFSIYNTKVTDLKPLKKIIQKGISVKRATFGEGILVGKSNIRCPPIYVIEEGDKAIINYWNKIIEQEESNKLFINNQTKLIFLGNSGVGKTSLWNFIKHKTDPKTINSTHGIQIETWDTQTPVQKNSPHNLIVHIWDFGGQSYYHATHRLFLSQNAVYIVVWEQATNKDGETIHCIEGNEKVLLKDFPLSYWLDTIKYYSEHNKPLIVQNKIDKQIELDANTKTDFRLSIEHAFGYIAGNKDLEKEKFYSSYKAFEDELLDSLRKNANSISVIECDLQVREELDSFYATHDYITADKIIEIVSKFDATRSPADTLAYLRNFTNTILHFPDNELLKDRIYLKPAHISDSIYKILNQEIRQKNGEFDISHVKKQLSLQSNDEAEQFIALMKEFYLIFEQQNIGSPQTPAKRIFVAPQYLPSIETLQQQIDKETQRASLKKAINLKFDKFTPPNIILRFVAQSGNLTKIATCWQNGIIYTSPFTKLEIRVDFNSQNSIFTIWTKENYLIDDNTDMQRIVEQFVELSGIGTDNSIMVSNNSDYFTELIQIKECFYMNNSKLKNNNGNPIAINEFLWLKSIQSMTIEQLRAQVNNLISNAKLKEAINLIKDWAENNKQQQLQKEIALVQGNFTELATKERLSLLYHSESSIEFDNIRHSIITVLDNIKEYTPQSEKSKEKTIKKSEPLRILMLSANPDVNKELNIVAELGKIHKEVENKKTFIFNSKENITRIEFKRHVEKFRPNMLQFSGHSKIESDKYVGLAVQSEHHNKTDYISNEDLSKLFSYFIKDEKINIQAVILNACFSAEAAKIVSQYVPYVIGTKIDIGDKRAIKFSAGFYYKLSNIIDFDRAYASGVLESGLTKSDFVLYK